MQDTSTHHHTETPKPDSLLYDCTIFIESHYAKKNDKVIRYKRGAPRRFTSRKSGFVPYIANSVKNTQSEHVLLFHMRRRAAQLNLDQPICHPVRIVSHFLAPNWLTKQKVLKTKQAPPPRVNQKAFDLDNIIQGPLDALVKAKVLQDDSFVTHIESRKIIGPRVCLKIEIYRDFTLGI